MELPTAPRRLGWAEEWFRPDMFFLEETVADGTGFLIRG